VSRPTVASASAAAERRRDRLGGTAGNRLLTSTTALVLAALLAAESVTILWLGTLRTEHMFIGLVLIGPVALKLASTGYRFARYYTRAPRYRAEGPPVLALRVLAPVLVATTLLIFASGVLLVIIGHRSCLVLELHKVAFIVWSGCFGVHFLCTFRAPGAHSRRACARQAPSARPARASRGLLLGAALGGGVLSQASMAAKSRSVTSSGGKRPLPWTWRKSPSSAPPARRGPRRPWAWRCHRNDESPKYQGFRRIGETGLNPRPPGPQPHQSTLMR
jgi:hypothetical protein